MYVQRNIEARWRNHCCRRKAVSIKYSECVLVALTRHIIVLSVACLALPYFFPSCLTNGMIFWEKKLLNLKCVLIFSTTIV